MIIIIVSRTSVRYICNLYHVVCRTSSRVDSCRQVRSSRGRWRHFLMSSIPRVRLAVTCPVQRPLKALLTSNNNLHSWKKMRRHCAEVLLSSRSTFRHPKTLPKWKGYGIFFSIVFLVCSCCYWLVQRMSLCSSSSTANGFKCMNKSHFLLSRPFFDLNIARL